MLYVVRKMMNREEIINLVEDNINDIRKDALPLPDINSTAVDSFLYNTVKRIINAKKAYSSNLCGYADFMVSLRNFLIAYQASINVTSIRIMRDNPFGIYQNAESGKYFATYDIPEFINHSSFVREAFINIGSENPEEKTKYLLKTNTFIEKLTGYKYFKSLEQKLCVYGGLNTPAGYTSLISMPTGGGKSLVTQTLAYERDGLTIVIVPTVSLAIDQERVAKEKIHSLNKDEEIFHYESGQNNISEIAQSIRNKTAKLLFISPEALIKNEQFKTIITEANERKYIKNIIIDEAHIVVAWGDFFRVDYQCLGPWRKELMKTTLEIRTFLLSATFQDNTVNSLKKMFATNDNWIEIRCDSLRKEPRFIFTKAKNYTEKKQKVLEMVNLLPHPMILYVNAPYEAKRWKDFLESGNYGNVRTFTGETTSSERNELIRQWSNDEFDIMVATSAFGVGVDKPDVRSVIHLYVPESPDSYYQELGRGGRDGLNCLSVMCVTDDDISSASNHVSKVLTTPKLWGRWWSMLHNPMNQWQGGLIAIMASTKPNYNKINFFEEGNDTDEKWNINVLLLLSRYEVIDIVGLDLDHLNRYIFTIKVLNELVIQENEKSFNLFDEIREKEANNTFKAFTMKDAIEKRERLCWSTMFYDTYPLVSEHCSGCEAHDSIETDEINRFPLLQSITGPEKIISAEAKEFFADTNEALIIATNDLSDILRKYNPDVIVCDDDKRLKSTDNPEINMMNFAEFKDLQARDNGFYISGLIMAIYSCNEIAAQKQYHIIYRVLSKYIHVIHVADRDFCVSSSSGKSLSNVVSGTVIR